MSLTDKQADVSKFEVLVDHADVTPADLERILSKGGLKKGSYEVSERMTADKQSILEQMTVPPLVKWLINAVLVPMVVFGVGVVFAALWMLLTTGEVPL